MGKADRKADAHLLRGFRAAVSRQTVGHGETAEVISVSSDLCRGYTGMGNTRAVAEALERVVGEFLAREGIGA